MSETDLRVDFAEALHEEIAINTEVARKLLELHFKKDESGSTETLSLHALNVGLLYTYISALHDVLNVALEHIEFGEPFTVGVVLDAIITGIENYEGSTLQEDIEWVLSVAEEYYDTEQE